MHATGEADQAISQPHPKLQSSRWIREKKIWVLLVIVVAVFLAYSNSFQVGFALDNRFLLKEDRIHQFTPQNLNLIFEHTYWWPLGEAGLYRPLTTLSFLFNYAILGNHSNPEGYHWINLLLHEINVVLAFFLALRLTRQVWTAAAAAALWGVHPVLTESVTNIVGRADLLAGLSVFGGMLAYLKASACTGWKRTAWLASLFLLAAIGIYSKENAIVLIGAIALYELTFSRDWRQSVYDLTSATVAIAPPTALFLYQRAHVLASSLPAKFPFVDNPIVSAGLWQGRFTALEVMSRYLARLAWPARLSSDYSYSQIPLATGTVRDWIAVLAVSALGVLLILLFRRQPAAFFGGLFAFGTFLPASNLLFTVGTIMAERLLYLPAFGLILCFVIAIDRISGRVQLPRAATAVIILAAGALAARTWLRNPDWQSDLTLSRSAVLSSPQSYKAHLQLADALFQSDPSRGNLDQVLAEAERGIAIIDKLPDLLNEWTAYRQIADYYREKRDYRREAELLSRDVSILDAEPPPRAPKGKVVVRLSLAEANIALARALLHVPDPDKAYAAAAQAAEIEPGSVGVWRTMGEALRDSGRGEEAVITLMTGQILTFDPGMADDMVAIYQKLPDKACTVVFTGTGGQPNPACPTVHRDICEAEARAIRILVHERRPDWAGRLVSEAQSKYRCDARSLALTPAFQ